NIYIEIAIHPQTPPTMTTRRNFIKKAVGTAVLAPALAHARFRTELTPEPREAKTFAANDHINIGVIGMGIMGFNNMQTSTAIPGVKLVAACDLYSGRLEHTKEVYGNDVFTTRNYQELLDRK